MSDVPQEFSGGVRPQDRRGAEDVLRALLECEYHRRLPASAEEVARTGGLAVPAAARWLGLAAREGLAEAGAGGFSLTEAGRKTAVRVMRAHRLTEVALARGSGLRAEEWHARAHAAEHRLTDAEVNRLAEALGHPRFDPHGDPIPTREGAWPEREGLCLLEWPAGVWGVIGHIEDEPKEVFAGIAAKGIFAGMRLVSEGGADGARVVVEGEPFALTREEAALVRV
ncbi:MAG: DNA-binding protein, partial [Opitutaceae bacterium]|nr:DNA-binding protein [Opitutaceae bacterium]